MSRPRQSIIEYRRYDFPDGIPVQIHNRMRWRISTVKSNRLHMHNCFEIGLCLSGRGSMNFGEEEVSFRAGDVLFVGRNVPHTTWSDSSGESVWEYIHLDPDRIMGEEAPEEHSLSREMKRTFQDFHPTQEMKQMFLDCHLILASDLCPWAESLLTGIMDEVSERAFGYETVVHGLCEALFYRLFRLYSEEGEQMGDPRFQSSGLTPALEYVHRNYMNRFPVEELAGICHMSPTHFRRRFQQQLGTNPLTYLHQVRMQKSRDLLRSTDLAVAEIADQVGYQSLSCFNRHFFELCGCTPSEWRADHGNGRKTATVGLAGWDRPETADEIETRNLRDSQGDAS